MAHRKSPAELLVAVKPHLPTEDYEDLQYYLWNAQMDFAKGIRQYDHLDWLKSRIKKIQEILSEPAPYAYEDSRADVHVAEQLFFPPRENALRGVQPADVNCERFAAKCRYSQQHSKLDTEQKIDQFRSTPKYIWEDRDAR